MDQAVILCGGKGTRLGEEFAHLPKPLVPVDGIPLLDRIIDVAVRAGASRIILAAGHHGEQIAARYAGQSRWPAEIHTHIEDRPLGTAGCLHEFSRELDEDFILLYGDVFLDFDLAALIARHEAKRPVATVLVRESDHPADSDLVSVAPGSDEVLAFLPKATRDPAGVYRNCANAAVYACSKRLLEQIPAGVSSDIATHAFPAVLAAGGSIRAHALEDTGYVRDMGTPARLQEVALYCRRKQRAVAARLTPRPLRAVILDRDGVILKDHGPSTDPDRIEFLPGALEGLARMESLGLVCLVATNQPWIARGQLTREQLTAVHQRMQESVRQNGGHLREVVFSPFHPETHHNEGIRELRRASECRKPRAGMLFSLMEQFDLDPAETVMIGDSRADIVAARNAGLRSILIGDPAGIPDLQPDAACPDLIAAAEIAAQWQTAPLPTSAFPDES